MGLLRLCYGDVLAGEPDVVAHGCEPEDDMDMDVSFELKKLFPEMYKLHKANNAKGQLIGGTIISYDGIANNKPLMVYTLIVPKGFNSASIEYLHNAIFDMCADAVKRKIPVITMPLIGGGIGGLNPSTCLNIYCEAVSRYDVTLDVVVQHIERVKPSPIYRSDTVMPMRGSAGMPKVDLKNLAEVIANSASNAKSNTLANDPDVSIKELPYVEKE